MDSQQRLREEGTMPKKEGETVDEITRNSNGNQHSDETETNLESNDENQPQRNIPNIDFENILHRLANLEANQTKQNQHIEQLETENTELKKTVNELKDENAIFKEDNKNLKDEINELKDEIKGLKKRISDLESLLIKNNISLDLLANRDSLKTILFIFSVLLDKSNIGLIKKDGDTLILQKKFTDVLRGVLKSLKSKLDGCKIARNGIENKEKEEEIKKDLVFIECIHFMICTIDNVVHPPENIETNALAKISGIRTLKSLQEGIKLFFKDPKTINDLKNLQKTNDNSIESKEDNNSNKSNNEPIITFESYDAPKSYAYKMNKEYFKEIHNNTYNNKFFIEHLFYPGEDDFSRVTMNIKYEDFMKKMNQTIDNFKSKNLGYEPSFLLLNLKWYA